MSATSKFDRHTVSVRALADFCLNDGDLVSIARPSPSALEGQQTHSDIQSQKRDAKAEVPLSFTWQCKAFELKVSGRADLIYVDGIEEIKSTRVQPDEIPDVTKAQHWLQAKIYAAMYALSGETPEQLMVKVTWAHSQTLEQWSEEQTIDALELIDFLIELCSIYDEWLHQVQQHLVSRNQYLTELDFPYPQMRAAQRQMSEDVYKSCLTERHLTIEAPTGTGKTLASIFPLLKAMPVKQIRTGMFLTMKTTGREAALTAVRQTDQQQKLATVCLSPRKRLCLNTETVCDGEYCPYAKDYYRKRRTLFTHLYDQTLWDDDALKRFGEAHQICPYYLSQDWSIWSDLIIGDINYIYDTTAVQPLLLKEIDNRVSILIDESHNLIDRGRMIYSADFSGEELQALMRQVPKSIESALKKIQTQLRHVAKTDRVTLSFESPVKLAQSIREFVAKSASLLKQNPRYEPDFEWQQFIFTCARFVRLNELADDEDFVWRLTPGKPYERKVELLCLNPAKLLQSKHNASNNVVSFSATLKPWAYSNQLNGLESAVTRALPSPFESTQSQVTIVRDVSTRYQHRLELSDKLWPLMEGLSRQSTNAMVFFSSYQQLHQCTARLDHSDKLLIQQRDWDAEQRLDVLKRFREQRGLVLFTVLGGVFSEGIDLPGDALELVVVIGPGLPQVNDVNVAMRERLEKQNLPGFDFAFTFPGLHKVLQAAGRCVRTETDRGRILLIDDRFVGYQQKGWLPDHWTLNVASLAECVAGLEDD
jgi:DNA excision repair protein ERCC-2